MPNSVHGFSQIYPPTRGLHIIFILMAEYAFTFQSTIPNSILGYIMRNDSFGIERDIDITRPLQVEGRDVTSSTSTTVK